MPTFTSSMYFSLIFYVTLNLLIITCLTVTPKAPEGLTVYATGRHKVRLTWNNVSPDQISVSYMVEYKRKAARKWKQKVYIAKSPVVIRRLKAGTDYQFRARSIYEDGDYRNTSAPSYVIDIKTRSKDQVPIKELDPNITPCQRKDYCLNGGSCYVHQAFPGMHNCRCTREYLGDRCQDLAENFNNFPAFTIRQGRPQNFSVSDVTESSVRLRWDAPADQPSDDPITMYRVTYLQHSHNIEQKVLNCTDTFITLVGLEANTEYVFRIEAYSRNGDHYWSNGTFHTTPRLESLSNAQSLCSSTQQTCKDVQSSQSRPVVILANGMEVMCDTVTDNGGWTVIQRRASGDVSFYRDWADYKYGFGNIYSNHWLGLEKVHRLTFLRRYELRIDITYAGVDYYALYQNFTLYGEPENYAIKVSGYSGNSSDGLGSHNGMGFTTKDRDNDVHPKNCAKKFSGAWWSCQNSNLNGLWGSAVHGKGLTWHTTTGDFSSPSFTEMKIRPLEP